MSKIPSPKTVSAEVIVVGAGPGGSAAARALAQRGRRVLLLEAARFPRDKVCGDVLLPELDTSLEALGLSLDTLAADARGLTGCDYTTPGGRRAAGQFCDATGQVHSWRILPRKLFDERLARAAAEAGAELLEEHRLVALRWDAQRRLNELDVQVGRGASRRSVTFTAPLVVGADGAGSRVAQARGLRPHALGDTPENTAVALRGYIPWNEADEALQIVTNPRILPGCCWIVPNAQGQANVGIVVVASARKRHNLNLHRELESVLGDRIDLGQVDRWAGWKLPGGEVRRSAIADGVLLVGDAAGFIDTFTGHGIQNALRTGQLAADAADEALRRGDTLAQGTALAGYQRAWRHALGGEFRLGRWLRRVHTSPWLMERIMGRAQRSRRWADRFMGLVGHAVPRHHALSPRFVADMVRSDRGWRGGADSDRAASMRGATG